MKFGSVVRFENAKQLSVSLCSSFIYTIFLLQVHFYHFFFYLSGDFDPP